MTMVRGQKAWALERWEQIAQHRKPLAECSLDELWRGELDLELMQLEQLRQHQHAAPQEAEGVGAGDERVQLLQTIPGVGRKTAEVVVAYIDDPHRFQNARQVSSYAGLVPRRYQSGEMDRQGRIHKRGPRQLRGALVEAAWMMLRYNPWAKSVYDRLTGGQKTRKKKAIVAVARKLLVRCWVMLLRKEPWKKETLTTAWSHGSRRLITRSCVEPEVGFDSDSALVLRAARKIGLIHEIGKTNEQRSPLEGTPETTQNRFPLREEQKASETRIVD